MYRLDKLVKDTLLWFSKDMVLDTTQERYQALVQGVHPVVKTPISECFKHIQDDDLLNNIFYISTIMNKKSTIPELLTVADISVYGKYVSGVSLQDHKKAWLNLSSMLDAPKNNRYADLSIAATNEVMSAVVRAMLCMSYDDSKEWLSPTLAAFVVEFYANTMQYVIDRIYKLDSDSNAIVKYAFAYYYAGKLSTAREKDKSPALLQKAHKLFKNIDISLEDLAEKMNDIVGSEDMLLNHVVKFISDNGPGRLSTLNADMIYRSLSISSHNSVSTWIAADYPPYLVHLLFTSLSGNKHPILNKVINNMFGNKYINTNVQQLLKYSNLYSGGNPNGKR